MLLWRPVCTGTQTVYADQNYATATGTSEDVTTQIVANMNQASAIYEAEYAFV